MHKVLYEIPAIPIFAHLSAFGSWWLSLSFTPPVRINHKGSKAQRTQRRKNYLLKSTNYLISATVLIYQINIKDS
jgi:hypothetical protein